MSAQQVMKYLNRSRSGLTSISDRLKPIPAANPTAEREYWKDEVIQFKAANPVNKTKQRAGRISRRNKISLTEVTLVVFDNQAFYSALENPARTGINNASANRQRKVKIDKHGKA